LALVIVALAAAVMPVAIRNAIVGGEFHITTSQLGPNFFIGNNAQASGTYVPLVYGHGAAKYERADATMLAEKAVGRTLSPGQVSRYWLMQAFDFIRAEPAAWVELMRIKTMLFWNATEIGDTEDQYVYADWSSILRVLNPMWHFGLLCALAAIGFVLTLRHWRTTWLLAAVVLVYAVSVIAFYVMARYRYPIVPVLMLFAAAGIVEAIDAVRGRRRVETWMIIVAVVWAGWVWLATRPIRNDMVRASTYQNIAHALDAQNKLDEAFSYYERARDLWPRDPLVHIMLGRVRLDQKRPADAIPHFTEAVRVAPEYAPAHVALGAGLLDAGQLDPAETEFRKALLLDPGNSKAKDGLEQVRLRQSSP
jgi:tetratricopeptide (TPR) repeat protein